MKPSKYWIAVILFSLFPLRFFGQIIDFCKTASNIPDILQSKEAMAIASRSISPPTYYTINIYFHIINKSDGTGGQTPQEVSTALCILENDYASHNIYFLLIGQDQINSDAYYDKSSFVSDQNGDGKFDDFSPNSHSNAIDIYLFPNDKLNYGLSANIPGTALVIGGNAFGSNLPSSHVLSHEVGHCLGLYHTFHGSNLEPIGCAEYVDESNCSTCGDFICDTPADPWSIYTCINQITCAWTGYQNNACCGGNAQDAHGDYYNPNPNIIMAYTTPNCMTTHTLGQITRLFNVIGASSLLLNTIPNLVSGPIVICSGGAQFTVNNVPQGYTVSWTSSSNIILPENKNVNPIVITGVNGSGTGWMMATLVSTCGSIPLPQYSVWVGVPPLFDISGPASIVLNNTEHFVADILPRDISSYGIYYYDWSVTSKLQFESSHAYRTDAYIKGISLGFGTISFYTTNGCGTSTYNFLVRVVSSKSLSIYPNPASNEITIEIDDEANFEDTSSSLLMTENLSDTEYLVTIYNNAGMPVFFNKYSNVNEIKISTSSWQSGIYYIVLTLNGENYSGSFIIE